MARYLARPPIASDSLSRLDDGLLELRLKRPLARRHDVVRVLAARAHLTRYFGVFAPAFAARAGIVPSTEPAAPRRRPPASEA